MRRTRSLWTTALAAAAALAAAPQTAAQEPQPAQPQMQETEDIIGVAQERGFREWARGVQTAELTERLRERPHTVFIAADPAYQEVPATQTQAWRTDPAAQRAAVGHTIVEGRLTMDELRQREFVTTIDGRRLPVRVEGDRVWVGDTEIREGDIEAGTGMIHRVSQVTWPQQTVEPVEAVEPVEPVEPVRERVRKN